jgi:hypothetical protein
MVAKCGQKTMLRVKERHFHLPFQFPERFPLNPHPAKYDEYHGCDGIASIMLRKLQDLI